MQIIVLDSEKKKIYDLFSIPTEKNLIPTKKLPFVPYFKVYFDFGYYFCINPFRFKLNDSGDGYILHKSQIQKSLCAIRLILAFVIRITSVRLAAIGERKPLVIYYFSILESLNMIGYLIAFSATLWGSAFKFERLIDQSVAHSTFQFQTSQNNKKWNKAIGLCTIASFMSFLIPLMGSKMYSADLYSISSILTSYLRGAQFTLFLPTGNYSSSSNAEKLIEGPKNWSDWFLVLFQFLAESSNHAMDFFASISILLSAVTLLEASLSFKNRLQSPNISRREFENILDQFYDLKKLSSALNGFVGPTVFTYILVCLSYFSTHLDGIFVQEDWLEKFIVIYFLINDNSILFLSAQVCQEISHFKSWLLQRDNQRRLSPEDMTILLADLSSNPIGISGCGKFIVDNGFIGNVGITLITLFVIVLQVKPVTA